MLLFYIIYYTWTFLISFFVGAAEIIDLFVLIDKIIIFVLNFKRIYLNYRFCGFQLVNTVSISHTADTLTHTLIYP